MLDKFPKILHQGRPLVWDYRQKPTKDSLAFVRSILNEEQRERFLKKFSKLEMISEDSDLRFSSIVAKHYANPSSKLVVVGVTGSNGKSSTCLYGAQLASLCGKKSAVIGTIGVQVLRVGSTEFELQVETEVTSPDSPLLQQAFSKLHAMKVDIVFVEVSSHSLSLDRVGSVDFDQAIFLNLTQDHLDFHGDMEGYFSAKRLLFSKFLLESSKVKKSILINNEGDWGERLFNELEDTYDHCTSIASGFDIVSRSLGGMRLRLANVKDIIELPLFGDFNAFNFFTAFRSLGALGVESAPSLKEFAKKIRPARGRMQPVSVDGVGLSIVDYAHTPDALEKAILALRHFVPERGRLITVFGCGGDRDRSKRSVMGGIAARLSDFVVVTSDNSRTEDPKLIANDILSGVELGFKQIFVELDRAKAISIACEMASSKDVILVAGKGHENYQIIGTLKRHFDDVEVLKSVQKVDNT
ncbi:UDP-N-acetylmuramoyl-L-alanyl-D-glutamate--2,6-diaminopimelate ligase [bacterium]|nr:UDP-N-acetylmuramoyl-L-alanyl-D-glutamate--2,6-diaminopimelate ligase [bacterium]